MPIRWPICVPFDSPVWVVSASELRLSFEQTLMRPPIFTEAQMAVALGDGAQVARETGCIYEITREAQLASAASRRRGFAAAAAAASRS